MTPIAGKWPALCAGLYVASVLLVDTLAAQDVEYLMVWQELHWQLQDMHRALWPQLKAWGVSLSSLSWMLVPAGQSFDLFKFCFWLLLPLLCCLPWLDGGWLGAGRMEARDWLGLLVIAALGAVVMQLIPWVPELRQQYPGLSFLPAGVKQEYLIAQLLWLASWLLGWEFLHRYLLLRAGLSLSARWGWLLVPVVEGLYHLQKPMLEMLGMVALSVVLTQWTVRRRTLLPALLAHLLIELELLLYQLW